MAIDKTVVTSTSSVAEQLKKRLAALSKSKLDECQQQLSNSGIKIANSILSANELAQGKPSPISDLNEWPNSDGWFPVFNSQALYLSKKQYINHESVAFMIEFPDELEIPILKRAVNKMVSEHDAFRLYFKEASDVNDQSKSKWLQKLTDQDISENVVLDYDFSGYHSDEFVSVSEQTADDLIVGLTIYEPFLFRVAQFRHNTHSSSRLALICHHLISDGVSAHLMLSRLIELYTCYSEDENRSSTKEIVSSLEVSNWLARRAKDTNLALKLKHWLGHSDWQNYNVNLSKQFVSILSSFSADEVKEIRRGYNVKKYLLRFSSETTQSYLGKMSNKFHLGAYDSLILTSLYALSQKIGSGFLPSWIITDSRVVSGLDLSNFIGFIANYTVAGIYLDGNKSFENWIEAASKQLHDATENANEFGVIYNNQYKCSILTDEQNSHIRNIVNPEVQFNYYGTSTSSNDDTGISTHRVKTEASNKNIEFWSLYFSFLITNNELEVAVSYNDKIYTKTFIDELCSEFSKQLSVDVINA
jgi:hypothetical protein